MDEEKLKQHEAELNNFLADIFRVHNIDCKISDNLIIFPKQRMTACTRLFKRSSSTPQIIQLDVRLEIGLGREIIESVAGMGMDLNIAVADAWKNFLDNSFHTLLAAFFTNEFDDQVSRYKWEIDGHKYDVVISRIGIRGNHTESLPCTWLEEFKTLIKKQELTNETHWIRLYYAQSENEPISTEIILDNNLWKAVVPSVNSLSFPTSKDFFSLRIFMVLRDVLDVSHAAAVLGWMAGEEEEVIENELIKTGLSISDAEKAEQLIPLAFGRAYLKKITTAEFSNEAIIKDEQENEFRIDLESETFYSEAYLLANKIIEEGCINPQIFQNIFIQSAELDAYNNALSEGVEPNELNEAKFGAPVIYLPHYQPEEKKSEPEELIKEESPSNSEEPEIKKKPLWKFWKK